MLRNLIPRLYQETILGTASRKNTLVVLPTGLGKTAIALLLIAQRLSQYPRSKIIFLAPTKPLADQHITTAKNHLDIPEEKYALFTGAVSPVKRAELWNNAQIIIGTPQGIENDVLGEKINIEDVSLLILDEAHHATGDYSYCFLAKQYLRKAKFPRILGLTASPGSDVEKIKEVCNNLFIEAVEVRTLKDPDVASYVKQINTDWVEVQLNDEFKSLQKILNDCYTSKLQIVKQLGYLNTINMRRKDILDLQAQLHGEISRGATHGPLLRSISVLAEALKIEHALALAETQGIPALTKYLQKLEDEARAAKSKAAKNIVADAYFKSAYLKALNLIKTNVTHPKFLKLLDIVKDELQKKQDCKMIIFTQYRDSATEVVKALNNIQGAKAEIFVGQAKKSESGMTQKEQKKILELFRENKFNILVCTSVGEEGLDIPAVDLVLFYEPIPSAIRHIQRRGRTGRQEIGRVIILTTKNTRDTAYRWVAHKKENQMYRILETLKKEFTSTPLQPTLKTFIPEDQKVSIVADYREKGSEVMKELIELGISLRLEKLVYADYLCSAQCAIEFKTVEDFVLSIIDGRMIEQLKEIKKNFTKPLVIVQGEQDIYTVRKVHPNAIRGMLASITIGFGIPILQTKNAKETASMLAIIAKREQDTGRDITLHSKKPLTLAEQQEYVVSSLPGVGFKAAQSLLKHFKTVENVVNAPLEKLKEVDGIGDVLAQRIKEVVEKEYKRE